MENDLLKLFGINVESDNQEDTQIPFRPENQLEEVSNEGLIQEETPVIESPSEIQQDISKKEKQREPSSYVSDIPEEYINTMPVEELKTNLDPEEFSLADEKEPELTAQEKLLEEFRKYKESSKKDIEDARQRDYDSQLLNNMNKAFSKIGTGLASGYANVKIDPMELKNPELEKQARLDNRDKLQNMLKEYEILSKGELTPYQQAQIDLGLKKLETKPKSKKYFNTADGIVAVDSKGGVELIKESELKKQRE